MMACRFGRFEIVKILLDNGANLEIESAVSTMTWI